MRIRHKIFKLSFLQVLLILSIGCKTHYQPVKSQFESVQVKSSQDTMGYSVTEKYLAPYRQQLQDSFSTVIATTTGDLVKRRPGGSLGNLVVEALNYYNYSYKKNPPKFVAKEFDDLDERRVFLETNFILMNYGGIRLKEIAKGKITIGTIYELLPFENTIVRVEISGTQLANLLEKVNTTGGWPYRRTFDPYAEKRKPVSGNELPEPLDRIRKVSKFVLITNNYIAQGGDNCSILKTLPQEDTGILIRDVLIKYLRKKKIIVPDNNNFIIRKDDSNDDLIKQLKEYELTRPIK